MPAPTLSQNHHFTTAVIVLGAICFLFPGILQWVFYLPLQPFLNQASSVPKLVCPPGCVEPAPKMAWFQKSFTMPSRARGSYLVTDEVVKALPEIKDYKVGLMNLFVQHTSCAISLNENWDSDVREDMSDAMDRIAPEDRKGNLYRHSAEGLDDMPVCKLSRICYGTLTIFRLISSPHLLAQV